MESVERDEWVPVEDQVNERKKLDEAAKATFKKTEKI